MSQDPHLRQAFLQMLVDDGVMALLSGAPTVTTADLIAEMRANAHGTDFPPEYYEEIARIVGGAPSGDGQLQPVIDDLVDVIESVLASAGVPVPEKYYAGQYPHGSFNAQSRLVRGGVLITVNSGLMMLIHQTAKVATLATRFTDFGPDGDLVEHPEIRNVRESTEEITRYLADVVLAYVDFEDSTYARRLPALGGVRSLLLGMLVEACETFALAHELGHVVDGHFSVPVSTTDAGWIVKRHNQEFAADEIAASVLIRRLGRTEDEERREIESAVTAAGGLFFFALNVLVDEVRNRVETVPVETAEVSTHPPALDRLAKVRSLFSAVGIDLSIADAFVGWIFERIDEVVTEVQGMTGSAPATTAQG